MAISLGTLKDHVYALIGMSSSDSYISETMLTSFINEGIKSVCMFGRVFPLWVTTTASLSPFTTNAVGTNYNTLYIASGVTRVVADVIAVTDSANKAYQRANPASFFAMFGSVGSVGDPKFWCWFARHVWLFPRLSGAEYVNVLALLMPNTLAGYDDVLDMRESFSDGIIYFAAHRVMQTLGRYNESGLFLVEFYRTVNESLDFIPSNFDGRTPGLVSVKGQ